MGSLGWIVTGNVDVVARSVSVGIDGDLATVRTVSVIDDVRHVSLLWLKPAKVGTATTRTVATMGVGMPRPLPALVLGVHYYIGSLLCVRDAFKALPP